MKIFIRTTFILTLIFLVSTVFTIIIVYKNMDNSLGIKFVIGWVIYLILYSLYLFIMVLMKMRKLKWLEIRKRLLNFLTVFCISSVLILVLNVLFHRSMMSGVSTASAVALGITFFDLAFIKQEKEV